MASVVDIRHLQGDPPDNLDIYRLKGGRPLRRDPRTVDSIVIHQMGTNFDVSDRQIAQAGGSAHEALHRRALTVKSHVSVFHGKDAGVRCYHVLITKPMDWYVYHGHKLNARSLGLEIEGNYLIHYDPDNPQVDDELVRAARLGVATLVREGRRAGMPIKYIFAHRQSSGSRARDPGGELWRKVVLEYAVPVLGLEIKPDLTVGTGRTIPQDWGRSAIRGAGGLGTAVAVVGGGAAAVFLARALMRKRARGARMTQTTQLTTQLSEFSTRTSGRRCPGGSACHSTLDDGFAIFAR